MNVGVILIGDELLTGKRQDKHLAETIKKLRARGMSLSWANIIGDDKDLLVQTFKSSLSRGDLVFSFGGIGATPDDMTRECAAQAMSVDLSRHSKAKDIIEKKFGDDAYPNRILMADLPDGADLIPNPINQMPGFSINHHHFVPGFPNMAWPMIDWVLDTHYQYLQSTAHELERMYRISGFPESDLVPLMRAFNQACPDYKLSSLPSTENRGEIEMGVRGSVEKMDEVVSVLEQLFTRYAVNAVYSGQR